MDVIHVNPSKMQNRRACDRCHQAKLKCVVEDGQLPMPKCRRCKRTNTECTFSPPSRNRVTGSESQGQPPNLSALPSPSDGTVSSTDYYLNGWSDVVAMSIDSELNVELDASILANFDLDPDLHLNNGVDTSALMPFEYDAQCKSNQIYATGGLSHGGANAYQTPPSPEREPSQEGEDKLTNQAYWTEKITTVNVQFTNHLQTIPRVNLGGLHGENSDNESSSQDPFPTPSKTHNADRTFQLSESFIDLLSAMCSKLPPSSSSPQQQGPSAAPGKKDNPSPPGMFLCLDESCHLLVFSTYLRLLDVHNTVFRYLLVCLVHKRDNNAPQGQGAGSCFYLPSLTGIGSFSLPKTSSTRPLLYVNLMESLLARARNLMHRVALAKGSGQEGFGGGMMPPVIELDLAMQAIRARETAVLELVERIKAALSRVGVT